MNYLEAVKELVNNPKAVAIHCDSIGRSLDRASVLSRAKFLLREDFRVEVKVEKTYESGYFEGYKKGRAEREEAAYEKFKAGMRKLYADLDLEK